MGYLIKNNRIVFKNGRAVKTDEAPPEIFGMVDMFIKDGIDPEMSRKILRETRDLEPERQQALISAINILSDKSPFVNAAQRMAAYDNLCEELSQLNTMRGGVKGFKGFVGEQMQAANATANGQLTRVVDNNGPIDLIFKGKNGRSYPQQLKIGYRPKQINFSKYKGQTVIVDKGNPYLRELQAEGARHGVKVIEGTVTEAEAKWWADAMQLETKITGKKTSVFVPEVQNAVNNLSAMHEAGLKVGKSGAMYGAGFSIGSNIVNMMRGNVSAGEAIGNVAVDTAVSYGVGYAGGAVGSAVARTAAGRAIGSAVGSAAAAIEGTAIGGAVTGAVGTATAAVGGLATSATAGAVGAIGAAGSAVGGALTAATAGTAIGGAVATGVAGATAAGVAVGAAAVAAAPVVAVGAVVGGLFSLFFDD
ncbi:MAG: hypothetical protein II857_00305 [Selenomonadaceae bacterium]|nr:hypothetical protein [Selenomonadaceae bacterium]